VDEARDVTPPSLPFPSIFRGFEALAGLTQKLQAWTELPTAELPSSHQQDHRDKDNYWPHPRRKM